MYFFGPAAAQGTENLVFDDFGHHLQRVGAEAFRLILAWQAVWFCGSSI